jgi:4-hydroxy-3-methylbut-2-enyl diphosphate reductase
MAERCDSIVVIGSANSSNTKALARLASDAGCSNVVRINTAEELPQGLVGVVGVTAGASAPEQLVREVLEQLSPKNGIELVRVTEEDEYFPPPRNIRDLQAAIECASTVLLGGGMLASPKMDDRSLSASVVLAALDGTQHKGTM